MAAPVAEDRAFVIATYNAIHGKNPSLWELDHVVNAIQSGSYTRERWSQEEQANNADQSVVRIFKKVVGADRAANDPGIQYYANRVRSGNMTLAQVEEEMRNSSSVQLRNAQPKEFQPTEGQENSQAYIDAYLGRLGLSNLSGWAWEELKSGKSQVRILQDLRERPEYKARFPGMDIRRAKGLLPIDEGQYLGLEQDYRNVARRFGLPPGFWDDPSDYTQLIAGDVSAIEYQRRVEEGYAKVMTAPPGVRATFAQYFGAEGDTAIATWMLDPDKAEALILKAADMARAGGFATLFGMNIDKARAEQLYDFGKRSDEIIGAYNRVGQMAPVFAETISESQDFTGENEGLSAALGLDATSQRKIERRGRTRTAATSGGGGALIGQEGLGAGSADG